MTKENPFCDERRNIRVTPLPYRERPVATRTTDQIFATLRAYDMYGNEILPGHPMWNEVVDLSEHLEQYSRRPDDREATEQ